MLSLDEMRVSKQAIRSRLSRLLAWYERNRRDLPWRRSGQARHPYRVLVAEVMLQQTRVAAVLPYYRRFLRLFPTARALARARPADVLRAWAGLGYYARARRLHAAARVISRRGFPSTYEELRALPGIGPYTARAVLSIAFGRPLAVLDGNVRRVLARLLKHPRPGQAEADALLDPKRPGDYNQALMELGATLCLPQRPLCGHCPLASHCRARQDGEVERFPRPPARRASREVRLTWALVFKENARRGRSVLLQPPGGDGLWPEFWNLPPAAALGLRHRRRLGRVSHTFTFRKIRVEVLTGEPARIPAGLVFVSPARLVRLPLATPARKALRFW